MLNLYIRNCYIRETEWGEDRISGLCSKWQQHYDDLIQDVVLQCTICLLDKPVRQQSLHLAVSNLYTWPSASSTPDRQQSLHLAVSNLYTWPSAISTPGRQQSLHLAVSKLYSWPSAISIPGRQQSLHLAVSNLYSWPSAISTPGRQQSLHLAVSNLYTWPSAISTPGRQDSHQNPVAWHHFFITWPSVAFHSDRPVPFNTGL